MRTNLMAVVSAWGVLTAGCAILSSRECATCELFIFDVATGELLRNVQVTIALGNDLGDYELDQYLEAFGEPQGTTGESGTVDLTICGLYAVRDPMAAFFELDYTFAVVGIERTRDSPTEIVLMEFESPVLAGQGLGRSHIHTQSISSDTLTVLCPARQGL